MADLGTILYSEHRCYQC